MKKYIIFSIVVILCSFLFAVQAKSEPLLAVNFDGGQEGFVYADDVFGTNHPQYASGNYTASGGFSGGGLHVVVGGVDGVDVFDGMSGGWSEDFLVNGDSLVTVNLRYRLVFSKWYDPGECAQALMGIDDQTPVVLTEFCDTGADSGWQQVTFNVSLTDGTHTITVGGYNNVKTSAAEMTDVYFDDIEIRTKEPPSTIFFDDFGDGNADNWQPINDGEPGRTGDWQVINGEYCQLNDVKGYNESYQHP